MGRPFKAVYTVTNVGADDALRVKVKDEWPSTSFEVLAGKAAASWTKLEAGDNRTFSIDLRPKVFGKMQPARATVDYQYIKSIDAAGESAPSDDEDEDDDESLVDATGYSSTQGGNMVILTEEQYSEQTASAVLPATIAAAGAFFIVTYHYNAWLHARGVKSAL